MRIECGKESRLILPVMAVPLLAGSGVALIVVLVVIILIALIAVLIVVCAILCVSGLMVIVVIAPEMVD